MSNETPDNGRGPLGKELVHPERAPIMDAEDAFRAQRREPTAVERSNAEHEFYAQQGLHENTPLIEGLMQECSLSRDYAVDAAAFVMENKHLIGRSRTNAADHIAAVRSEVNKAFDKLERLVFVKERYVDNHGDREMAEATMWLLFGRHSIAGASNLAQLVKRFGGRKATVNKCLQFFQDKIPELGLLPGQRPPDARKTMSQKRDEQVKKSSTHP